MTTFFAALALGVAVAALLHARRLSARIEALEKRISPEPAQIATEAPVETPETGPWARASKAARLPKAWPKAATPGALSLWLRDNWIYPVAGVALMLAGVFLVQYGIEAGLISPAVRVMAALAMGLIFVAAGEWLRRRATPDPRAAFLPATFAAAGVVVLHAAVLSALHLYGLIGARTAFVAMAAITLGALALGWVHGALLGILGVVAGAAVPFALGPGEGAPAWLFGYFTALAAMGLGIGGLRRWPALWPVALIAPGAGAVLIALSGAEGIGLYLLATTALAMTLPGGALVPRTQGEALSTALRRKGQAEPATKAAALMAAFSAITLILLENSLLATGILVAQIALFALATRHALPMRELAVLPAVALPLWAIWQGLHLPTPEPRPLLVLMAAGIAGALALCRLAATADPQSRAAGAWVMLAVALPAAMAVVLELFWNASAVFGAYNFAMQIMGLAGGSTLAALWAARWPKGRGRDLAIGASASMAFALIALAQLLILGQAAMTLALGVLMVAAAAMERRLSLPLLGAFQALALMALIWRIVIDPGLFWLLNRAGMAEFLLILAASLAAPALTLWIGARAKATRAFVETGLVALGAIAAALVLARFLPSGQGLHVGLGLQATVFIALSWTQAARAARMGAGFARLRRAFALVLGAAAGLCLGLGVSVFSPLRGGFWGEMVTGGPIANDLILAYGLPGAALWALAGRRWLKGVALALLGLWAALAIRHLWQGPDIRLSRGIAEGELYAYTVALLVLGAALLARALTSGRSDLRRAGMSVVALAAAKAFLIDAAGLDGLLRVFAFLGLGLALAGLAWLNRWARGREHPQA